MIIIVPELEFDEVKLAEVPTSIVAGLSLLAGSADPGEEEPAKTKAITKTKAKHRNLTSRLNVPSNRPRHGALNSRDLFSQKNSLKEYPPPRLNVPSGHPGQDASSHTLPLL